MIYDLKKLKDRNLRATEYGNPTSDFAVIRSEILLAIAERLEALLEAQKPRLQGEPDRNENETPQPVATLGEVVDGLLRDDHFWAGYKEDSVRLYHALTAERKRAELVEEAFREYKAGHVTNCACRACEALRALDAFDNGAENG